MKKESTGKNRRSLDAIANDIHALDRTNVFAKGELLLEARGVCEQHGEWSDWLRDNGWSWDTANRHMRVAELGTNVRSLRTLRLAKVTLYSLIDEDEDLMPAIIAALVKAGAAKTQLKPAAAKEAIRLVWLRHKHGDYPDATLLALDIWCTPGSEASHVIIAALKKNKPETQEAAEKIVYDINRAHAPGPSPAQHLLQRDIANAKHIGQFAVVERALASGAGQAEAEAAIERAHRPIADQRATALFRDELKAELLEALRTLARHAQQPLPTIVGDDITGIDLDQIVQFIGALHRKMHKDSMAKIVADRAEARSRKTGNASS
jgi:hypothetical protein